MSEIYCGVDFIRIDRIKQAVERRGNKFVRRVFTAVELTDCLTQSGSWRWPSLAARFAAKEAVAKALGRGLLGEHGIALHDVSVVKDSLGRPMAELKGKAKAVFNEIDGTSIALSLAHEGDYAIAYCTILCVHNK